MGVLTFRPEDLRRARLQRLLARAHISVDDPRLCARLCCVLLRDVIPGIVVEDLTRQSLKTKRRRVGRPSSYSTEVGRAFLLGTHAEGVQILRSQGKVKASDIEA